MTEVGRARRGARGAFLNRRIVGSGQEEPGMFSLVDPVYGKKLALHLKGSPALLVVQVYKRLQQAHQVSGVRF